MEGEVAPPPHRRALQRPIVVSDDEDEDEVDDTPKRPTRGARTNPIVLSDDSSDDYPEIPPIKLVRGASLARQNKQPTKTTLEGPQPLPKLISRPTQVEVSIPVRPLHLAPKPSRGHGIFLLNKPALKSFLTRSRSPRRSQRNAPQKKTRIPQLSSTFDLERSFADLSISADVDSKLAQPRMPPGPSSAKLSPSQYLLPLLTECGQSEPHCFDTFVATFPLDDLHDRTSTPLAFHKIGEASYSEVFAIGDVVIKIVPLRDESNADEQSSSDDIDLPQESDAKDVLQEMIVTRTMGQICPGFIKLLRAYVVVGGYPASLLSQWDEFNDGKESENIRPDVFPATQAYALLVLPNGGPDLEAYTLPMKHGWRQACSIFWQTAKALAIAEELVCFEHRDLHWGQILVKSTTATRKVASRSVKRRNADSEKGVKRLPMDHPRHGVTATIIDLGLARMDAGDGSGSSVHYTPFDDLIFEGKGDYQFDIYRMMRRVHGNDTWDKYCPLTNIMWLHYLALKLLRSKRLRAPGTRTSTIDEFGEKQCHDCLIETEQLLGSCMAQLKNQKNRTKYVFSAAGDVVRFAQDRGWLD
ncbi:hypothetical protein K439DRAFT_1356589 [Ramaria rubella]|nr:hypothetical protein K439DRAFT_1356589 [Ramaria rubella]